MKKLLLDVLKNTVPDKEYEKEILSKASKIIQALNKGLPNTKSILGGSGAKGTSLKTFDADIFVKFNYKKFSDKSDKLSDILEKFLKKKFKIYRLHGSRDYFQIKENKFTFEIVPILDIKKSEQAKNITDVSPLHSNFVLKHKKLTDEMRLAKQFFKSAKVYGAESYIRGFSGYVCEILIVSYGSFSKLIRAVSKWEERTVIDVKGYYKRKNVFSEINKSKLTSPLIVIDPVQKDRNAAAALDYEKFDLLKLRATRFLKNPSSTFFDIETLEKEGIKKKYPKSKLIMLKANPLKKKHDVAGAKMLKAFHFLKTMMNSYGFKVEHSDMLWHSGKDSLFYYVLKNDTLPKKIEVSGPPLKFKENALLFKKKHKKTFVKGKRLFALESREFTKAKDYVKSVIKIANVQDNVVSIKII